MSMLLIRQIEADPPEITTQPATCLRPKDSTQYVHNTPNATTNTA